MILPRVAQWRLSVVWHRWFDESFWSAWVHSQRDARGIVDRQGEGGEGNEREEKSEAAREKSRRHVGEGDFRGRKKSAQTGNYLLTEEKLGGLKWGEMGQIGLPPLRNEFSFGSNSFLCR